MKTRIYIDGYNFYYGLLNGTSHKWLNLDSFTSSIIKQIVPESIIDKIYYFTSPVKAQIATHGKNSNRSQNTYHEALKAFNSHVEIINGYHDIRKKTAPMRLCVQTKPNRQIQCDVWHIEEKQTDVNISIQIIKDILKDQVEHAILISNDTDLAPALRMSKELKSELKVGVIFPIRDEIGFSRMPNKSLADYADWKTEKIKSIELAKHQLPNSIPKPNGRGVYMKPDYW